MKIRQSYEQAVCILLLIGVSNRHIKSSELSFKLDVSDSYLKKITRQLVVSGLIESRASKKGGFVLKRPLNEITLLDVYEAIEGKEPFISTTHLVNKVFEDSRRIHEAESYMVDYFTQSEELYRERLSKFTLAQIVSIAQKDLTVDGRKTQ